MQETVRMREMGRMQEVAMKEREWGKPSGYHGWVAGAVAPTSPMHHGTEAQRGPGAQGQRRRGGVWVRWVACSGVEGLGLAEGWGLVARWAGVREVRTHTMGSGAQSGQEGCGTEG